MTGYVVTNAGIETWYGSSVAPYAVTKLAAETWYGRTAAPYNVSTLGAEVWSNIWTPAGTAGSNAVNVFVAT